MYALDIVDGIGKPLIDGLVFPDGIRMHAQEIDLGCKGTLDRALPVFEIVFEIEVENPMSTQK